VVEQHGTMAKKILTQRLGAERQRVRALIERAGVAMLMNIDEHDTHAGRPMLPSFIQNDSHIFFLTHQSSRKVM
jgi:general stress protein 26